MRIHRHRQRKPKFAIPGFRINEGITSPTVRVIDAKNEMRGVMTTQDAINLAVEQGLDLIEVSPKAEPPVCKIIDFGSFKYQKEKEMKKQRAQSKEVEVKGIRLSPRIGDNDLNIRLDKAKEFLEKGNKVRAEMILRGREKAHGARALEIFAKFYELLSKDYPLKIESPAKNMNGKIQMIIARA